MEPSYTRLVELSERLRSATDDGRVEWALEDDTSFFWAGASGSVGVRSRDGDGEEPFELALYSAAKQKVETLTSEWSDQEEPAAWNDPLARLYRAARRQALGVDRILDDLLAELPRAREASAGQREASPS